MNKMNHNNKKLNGNEKDDDDCDNLGNLKFKVNAMDRFRINMPEQI